MDPQTVAAMLDEISALFTIDAAMEVTLEANPTSVEAARFADFNAAGVNRISMGIQSLVDSDLKRLGRMHTASEAMAAFEIAQRQFDRVSFDLIYARQDQTLAAWEKELTQAIQMSIGHLSLYQLTIEHGTRFGELAAKNRLRGLPTSGLSADMYQLTQDICHDAGMPAYEVSNHAAEGQACRHNLTYWRYGPYLGIGPGAHGRVQRRDALWSTESILSPENWLSSPVDRVESEKLSAVDCGVEYLLMSMRLREGSDIDRFESLSGHKLSPSRLTSLKELGLITCDGPMIRATDAGLLVLNSVISELCEDWSKL